MNEEKKMTDPKHRSYMAGEHTFGDLGQILLLIIFLVVWFSDSYIFNFSTNITDFLPLTYRILIAIIILITSAFLVSAGLNTLFGKYKDVKGVINNGIYGKIRHPIYLGSIMFYLGFIILTFSIASFICWIVVIVFYNYIARYEERLLLKYFGEDYLRYKKNVRMWIPRLF